MEFRVLGPLEVVDDGERLPLGGPRQRLVLAYLLLEANRVIPTDRLIDRIWGDEPPEAARNALFAYISRLKKLLGGTRIQARPPGYVLVAASNEIDALHFADLIGRARQETESRRRAQVCDDALRLWRGEPLSDLAQHDSLRPHIARLEELRLTALEVRAEAQLAIGDPLRAVSELEALVAEYPLRERLWALLMVALYRSGRQADALAAYHRARARLVEELGIDPSAELRRLEEQILNQDPVLDRTATPPSTFIEPQVAAPTTRSRRPTLAGLVAAALIVAVIGAAVWASGKFGPHGLPPGPWTIALDMPLSRTDDAVLGVFVRDAVQMAIDDANAAGIAGTSLSLRVFDDFDTSEQAQANTSAIISDATVIAMIGPWHSRTTFAVLPMTNEAGLLECSPSATHPGLTKPRYGALDLRAAHPEANNFVRVPPADDIQAVALAAFAFGDLGARTVLVVDEVTTGRELADAFESSYERLGGQVIRRTLNPGAAGASVLDPFSSATPPEVVFIPAPANSAARVRTAMADAGLLATPLLGWDALLYYSTVYFDPPGVGPYVDQAGVQVADGTYVAHATLPDYKFSFADAYRTRFMTEPDEYAAAGYACVEIIASALRALAPAGPSATELRGLVRSFVADPAHQYDTVVGNVSFDANGDSLQQFVTFYRFDASAAGGAGDWIVFKKQDFGPAP